MWPSGQRSEWHGGPASKCIVAENYLKTANHWRGCIYSTFWERISSNPWYTKWRIPVPEQTLVARQLASGVPQNNSRQIEGQISQLCAITTFQDVFQFPCQCPCLSTIHHKWIVVVDRMDYDRWLVIGRSIWTNAGTHLLYSGVALCRIFESVNTIIVLQQTEIISKFSNFELQVAP